MKKQIFTIILLLMGGVTSFGQFKFDSGTNSLRLQTGGVDRLYITPPGFVAPILPGNIGIGTTLPYAKLTVAGDMALQKIQRETISGGYNDYDRQDASIVIFENGGTIGGIAGGSRGQILYVLCGYGNNQSALTIRHDSPSNPTAANRILTHTGADFVIIAGAGGVLLIYDDTKQRWRIVETPSGSGTAGWGLTGNAGTNPATQFIGTTDAQGLAFKTNNVERISVESGGDVGIGITTADSKLHVHRGSAGAVTAFSGSIATFENSTSGYLSILTPATTTGGILFGSPTAFVRGSLQYNHSTDKMSFATTNADRMTIDGTGNVGIGTTTPTAKLDVEGDIVVRKTTFSGTGIQNALNRTGGSSLYFNGVGTVTLNGIAGGVDGMLLYIINSIGTTLVINNQSASATATNRIATHTGGTVTITDRGGATLIYESASGLWRIIGIAN